MLGDRTALGRWIDSVKPIANPFGDADSPARIATAMLDFLSAGAPRKTVAL
jgi:hypothetical protein